MGSTSLLWALNIVYVNGTLTFINRFIELFAISTARRETKTHSHLLALTFAGLSLLTNEAAHSRDRGVLAPDRARPRRRECWRCQVRRECRRPLEDVGGAGAEIAERIRLRWIACAGGGRNPSLGAGRKRPPFTYLHQQNAPIGFAGLNLMCNHVVKADRRFILV
jgi:hypothetical protein